MSIRIQNWQHTKIPTKGSYNQLQECCSTSPSPISATHPIKFPQASNDYHNNTTSNRAGNNCSSTLFQRKSQEHLIPMVKSSSYLQIQQGSVEASSFPSARGSRYIKASRLLPADMFQEESLQDTRFFFPCKQLVWNSCMKKTLCLLITGACIKINSYHKTKTCLDTIDDSILISRKRNYNR